MDRAGYFEDGRWGFARSLTIEATIETVWANVCDPEQLSQWGCPPPTVQVQFDQRVGGDYKERYRNSTSAYELSGKVLELEAPCRLVIERSADGRFGSTDRISITLTSAGGVTTVKLLQTFDGLTPSCRDAAYDFFADGWSHSLQLLKALTTNDRWLAETRSSYDVDAPGYTEQILGLLDRSPHLRASISIFADMVQESGGALVADIGCGPGYVTKYLQGLGMEAFGIDLSPEMVAIARRDHPELCFKVGTMTDLDLEDASLSGIVAFWSIIHIPDRDMPGVFDEFRRVLRPGGLLLVGFHVGDSADLSSVGYTGEPINLRSYLRQPSTVAAWLYESEFTIESTLVMRPDDKQPGALLLARAPR